MFELAKLDSGVEQQQTQFPIDDKREKFAQRNRPKDFLRGISPAHVAQIERYQPYMGCLWSQTLRDISNLDKHRELVRVGGEWDVEFSHPFKGPDLTARPRIPKWRDVYHAGAQKKLMVRWRLNAAVTLEDGTPILQALELAAMGVSNTLRDFESDFA